MERPKPIRALSKFASSAGATAFDRFRSYATMAQSRMNVSGMSYSVVLFQIPDFAEFSQVEGHDQGIELTRFVNATAEKHLGSCPSVPLPDGRVIVLASRSDDLAGQAERTCVECETYGSMLHPKVRAGICKLDVNDDLMEAVDCAKIAATSIANSYTTYVREYTPALAESMLSRKYVENNVERAVQEGWVRAYYQPVVDVQTGELVGLEALSRWIDPTYGFLSPADFIPTLEDTRRIHVVDAYVIDCTCAYLEEALAEGLDVVPVSVNLSRYDFAGDILKSLGESVSRHGLDPSYIDVEITESASLEDAEWLTHAIEALHDMGHNVWMDDFGSGYSSLNTLKDYDFDTLKIDMAFLRSNGDKEVLRRSHIIVSNVVRMAKELGTQTLCEGVEDDKQLAFLREIGCQKAQGYLFSKPVPWRDLAALDIVKAKIS